MSRLQIYRSCSRQPIVREQFLFETKSLMVRVYPPIMERTKLDIFQNKIEKQRRRTITYEIVVWKGSNDIESQRPTECVRVSM